MISKERTARILLRIATIFLVAMLVLWATSCASKKKTVEKSKYTTEIATVERIKEKSESETKTDISISETSKETTTTNDENFEGEIADPTKPATITDEEKDGKKIKTYTNFKNVKTGFQNSESETNKTLGQNLSKTDKSKSDKESKNETDLKASGKTIEKDLEVERSFPWHWVILAVLVYAVISYKRKTLNPLGWLS